MFLSLLFLLFAMLQKLLAGVVAAGEVVELHQPGQQWQGFTGGEVSSVLGFVDGLKAGDIFGVWGG